MEKMFPLWQHKWEQGYDTLAKALLAFFIQKKIILKETPDMLKTKKI